MDTYHWDDLVTYHWDVVGCLIWDLFDTSWRRTDGTLLLLPPEISSRRWVFHSRRTCDVTGTYRGTFLWCRLVAGWIFILQCLFICFDIYLSHYSLKFFQSSLKGFIFELRDVNFVDLYLRFDVNKDWCLQPNASSLRKSKFHRLRMVPQLSFLHYLLFF